MGGWNGKVQILSKQLIIHYIALSLIHSPPPKSLLLSVTLTDISAQHTDVSSLLGGGGGENLKSSRESR